MIVNHKEFQIYIDVDANTIDIKKMNQSVAKYTHKFDFIIVDHPYIKLYSDDNKFIFQIKLEYEGLVFDIFKDDEIYDELGYIMFGDY